MRNIYHRFRTLVNAHNGVENAGEGHEDWTTGSRENGKLK